jgi:hypothetical protein
MSKLAENIKSIHQDSTHYALEVLEGTERQFDLLDVSFRDVLETFVSADTELNKRRVQSTRSKARFDELWDADYEFAQDNLIASSVELQCLGMPLVDILKMLQEILTEEPAKPIEPLKPDSAARPLALVR